MCAINLAIVVLIVVLHAGLQGGECGVDVGTLLIAGGHETQSLSVPWNAGLFRPAGAKKSGAFNFICGGTLITTSLVVSAAHCLYNQPQNTHKIALGKFYRHWDLNEDDLQRKDIRRFVLHPRYRGSERNYEHDICVIELATPAELTRSVQVAVAVWTDRLRRDLLNNGNRGIVAGWGNQLSGEESFVLRSIELPYVDPVTCEDSVSAEFKKLVTHDKFCAGFLNQSKSVCRGDSGSGLIFRDAAQNRTYLGGVTSVAFKAQVTGCISQHYAAFTDVTEHYNQLWLQTFFQSRVLTVTPASTQQPPISQKPPAQQRPGSRQLPGYQSLSGLPHSYRHHTKTATWQAAKEECEQEGAHLVIINSEQESDAVKTLSSQNRSDVSRTRARYATWVGVKESDTVNGDFFTVLGGRLDDTGFTRRSRWYSNYPALGDVLYLDLDDGGLGDRQASGNWKLVFTCETAS